MEDWQERYDGAEDEFHDRKPKWLTAENVRPSEAAEAVPPGMFGPPPDPPGIFGLPAEDQDEGNYDEMLEAEYPILLAIARDVLRSNCSDRADHIKDVVQQGVKKFLQALRNRKTEYDTPAKVLRSAVWQEAVRHSQTCFREQAVDFNESVQVKESDAANPTGYNSRELTRATSFDPREIYIEMLDLKEHVSKATDEDQDLFVRRFVEGETLEEIARIRGWPLATVHRRLRKLMKNLGIQDDDELPPSDPEE